jgi:hypothetical protein
MKLSAEQHRALTMLADVGPRGVAEAPLVNAHGFTVDTLAGLVRAGYASVAPDTIRAGPRTMTVVKKRITDPGGRRSRRGIDPSSS